MRNNKPHITFEGKYWYCSALDWQGRGWVCNGATPSAAFRNLFRPDDTWPLFRPGKGIPLSRVKRPSFEKRRTILML